jgi:predicted RNA-binding Zn ribbon-like protein
MTDNRPPAIFIADAPGLDFLNSIATPVDTAVEWLASGEDLLAWLKEAGLVPAEVLPALRKSAVPGELDAVAAQARALREWFRAFVYEHKGRPLRPDALHQLKPLNRVLARDEAFGQIVARGHGHDHSSHVGHDHEAVSGLAWLPQRRWRSPDTLLLPVARAMAELICTEDFTHVKACEGQPCTLLFVDRTRSRARRWCSMAVCGNRAKQAAHRGRAQQAR